MQSPSLLRLVNGFLLCLVSASANAQLGEDVAASWVEQVASTPVPTFGSFGATALAVVTALLLYRHLAKNPRNINSLIVTGAACLSLMGAAWTATVLSNGSGTVVTIPNDAECSATQIFSDGDIVSLANDCPNPVKVYYSVTQTSACGLEDLSCYEPSTGLTCVEEGGVVPANGGEREFLGCHAAATPITNNNFRQAIDDWLANGNASEYGDITQWDTSNVTDMSMAFREKTNFNADISGWNTSNVTDMTEMFYVAKNFNQPIGDWDTSNVTSMRSMFEEAEKFNQPVGTWSTGKVETMNSMFKGATAFNQDVGTWDTQSVTTMNSLFRQASNFNRPIGDWDTSNVTNMTSMFSESAFNQPIGQWNTNNVKFMSSTFSGAAAFNQDIGQWVTGNVIRMGSMFEGASSFNQPIGNWDTSSVQEMDYMFASASNFNQNIGNWNTAAVEEMEAMFSGASQFAQDLSAWNVANVEECDNFAENAGGLTLPNFTECSPGD